MIEYNTGKVNSKRGVGDIILAVFLFLFVLPSGFMSLMAGLSGPPDKTIFHVLIRLFFMLQPIFYLVAGLGILGLRKWARRMVLGLSYFIMIFICFGFGNALYQHYVLKSKEPFTELFSIPLGIFLFAPFLITIFYLNFSNVKQRFVE